jgi:hypothetical protein
MRDTSLWNMDFKYIDMAGKIRERYALSIIPMLLIPNYLPLSPLICLSYMTHPANVWQLVPYVWSAITATCAGP